MIHLPHTKVTQQTGAAAPQRGPRPIQTSFHDLHAQGGRGAAYSKLSWCCGSPRDVGLGHVCPCPISLGDTQGCLGLQLLLGRTSAFLQLLPKQTGKDSSALGGKTTNPGDEHLPPRLCCQTPCQPLASNFMKNRKVPF